jgi:hypothetical protein
MEGDRQVLASGLGLGLAFSRWGVEANGGRISARSLPDHGCVFTVDPPRVVSDLQLVAVPVPVASGRGACVAAGQSVGGSVRADMESRAQSLQVRIHRCTMQPQPLVVCSVLGRVERPKVQRELLCELTRVVLGDEAGVLALRASSSTSGALLSRLPDTQLCGSCPRRAPQPQKMSDLGGD